MKHLLLTRFQGALIGGNIIYITPQQIAPNPLAIASTPALMGGITSLIRCGGFDREDWEKSTFTTTPDSQQAIVVMLPLMLFFHGDRVKLRKILIQVSHGWQLDWETCSSAVAIGYIVSRSIVETFNPRTIIPQLLEEMTNLHPLLFQQLGEIDRLLDQSSSLYQVTQKLTAIAHPIITPTVLGIYSFLFSPEDFSVAILRSHHMEYQSQFICTLTGILAGTHNSLTGIPLNGYIATQAREQWLSAAESLLTSWAGMYHEHSLNPALNLLPASQQPVVAYTLPVASPQVMQRRD